MFLHPKNLISENNNPWFKPWFNILLHAQSIMCATVDSQCLEYLGCITLALCLLGRVGTAYFHLELEPQKHTKCLLPRVEMRKSLTLSQLGHLRKTGDCLSQCSSAIPDFFFFWIPTYLLAPASWFQALWNKDHGNLCSRHPTDMR